MFSNASAPPPPSPARLAVVEDDAGFRASLVELLGKPQGWSCVAACANASAALRELPGQRPDLVLIDIRLRERVGRRDQSGLDLVPHLKALLPKTRLVMLTVVDDTDDILQAIQDGASGYILKGGSADELVTQIGIILDGGAFMSSVIARRLMEWFHARRPTEHLGFGLTEREWEVLGQRARGKSREQIGAALGISPNTVRNHFSSIYTKFGVRDAAAIIYQVGPVLRVRETLRAQEGLGHDRGPVRTGTDVP